MLGTHSSELERQMTGAVQNLAESQGAPKQRDSVLDCGPEGSSRAWARFCEPLTSFSGTFVAPRQLMRNISSIGLGVVLLAHAPDLTHAVEVNLAVVAKPTTSFVSGHETLAAINDGFTPANSDDKSHGAYGNWPRSGTQWVQYDWTQPISTRKIDAFWFDDHRGVRLPKACRLLYWDGNAFVPVKGANGLGLEEHLFNTTTFDEVTTSKLRLEMESNGTFSTGILEWRVYDSGNSPNFAPVVTAGTDAVMVLPGKVYLSGSVKDDGKKATPVLKWTKKSGLGTVSFEDATSATTTARFSKTGDYLLQLTANDGELTTSDTVKVKVEPAPPTTHLDPVWTTRYTISSPFWRLRIRNIIVNWIPHCVQKINDPTLPEGGIENFVQAANKLAGKEAKHAGAPFANAWVYNTLESMCLATLVNAAGDGDVLRTQAEFRKTIDDWVPKLLGAQEPDGYLQTMYTIRGLKRWSNRSDHEDYNAGYFLDAAIAHYEAAGGEDRRMLEAAIRLANCWCDNIGPGKRDWFAGHQEYEQSLVRFARFLKTIEPLPVAATPQRYVALAKFLMDSRRDGEEYDQSHLPVIRQYEAVGHAVRAVYGYSGMTDIAMETGDMDYYSAVKSLWNSVVNRKYYVTGGVGSGETSEGFGKDFSLPNRAYCESCAGCGELFFQYKMQLAFQQSRYADLFEETLYNAVLGGLDLEAQSFTYTNPLDSSEKRYKWHGCPCCVGNLPRTLLSLPTWMYSKAAEQLYVNLFAGSIVDVGTVGGASVRVTQTTDYPWSSRVSLVISPVKPARFTVNLRAPNRHTSELYRTTPGCDGLTSVAVNGKSLKQGAKNGYVSITRKWAAGDRIDLEVPLRVQRITPDTRIPATAGRVALRYGPLIYNLESVDQDIDAALAPDAPLTTEWDNNLLGGVMVIKGKFANGTPLKAIPNYARLNRGGRSIVWIKTP
jgi:uncharacterized protein